MHDLDHLRTNGLREVGERGHGVAIAQKTSIARGLVVENQRSVARTTARRRHPIFLFGLRIFSVAFSKEIFSTGGGPKNFRSAGSHVCVLRGYIKASAGLFM